MSNYFILSLSKKSRILHLTLIVLLDKNVPYLLNGTKQTKER